VSLDGYAERKFTHQQGQDSISGRARRHSVPMRSGIILLVWQLSLCVILALVSQRGGRCGKKYNRPAAKQMIYGHRVPVLLCRPFEWPREKRNELASRVAKRKTQ